MMSTVRGGAWVRAEAANVVEAVIARGKSLDATLRSAEQYFEPRDRSLLRMLAYGVLRHHYRLREQIGILLDRPLKKRDKVIESLIAVGLFQLTDTRVPDHAAVSTTVEAARLLRRPKYAGLINAVLRNSTRKDIPGRKSRKQTVNYDKRRYKRRNRIEIMFGRLKDWRRVATRYDRCPETYLSAIALAAIVLRPHVFSTGPALNDHSVC